LVLYRVRPEVKMGSDYFIRSARLGFRRWLITDLPLALQLWGDYKVTKLIDSRGPLSKAQVKERLDQEIAMDKKDGVQYWPIFLLQNHGFIGCCGLRPYDPSKQIYEMGFHICSSYWRQGYAQESARATMTYAFNTLRVKALFAGHNPKNENSSHLLKKLGFKYIHDAYYPPTGLNHPSYLLTGEDFSH